MTTFVGTQRDFMKAIMELIELDYDAVEAYGVAVSKLSDANHRAQLSSFMKDHQEHIDRLSEVVRQHGGTPPTGPSTIKQWLTKGKVHLATLLSNKAILQAMLDNEQDTNQAYARMQRRADQWEDATPILAQGMKDEMNHKQWLEQAIASGADFTDG